MSTTILRTADAWWVDTGDGAARIETDATTTGELLAEPEKIEAARSSRQTVDPATLELVSPVTAPCRVVAQMTNYASHVKDAGLKPETIPLTFFRKTSGSISGPYDDIVRPGHVRFLDYEVEVGVVIGRELPVGTQVTADNWATFVAGLVVTNDVSARDVQLPKTQFFESKSYPTFTPVGPALVLLDENELKRFGDLRLRLWVNGEIRQDALVDPDMIFSPLRGAGGVEPVPAARPGRPAADRHPGGDRAERAGETGRSSSAHCCRPRPSGSCSSSARPGTRSTSWTATSSRSPSAPTTARSTSAGSARSSGDVMGDLLWPVFDGPADLAAIEAVPLGRPWSARHHLRPAGAGRPVVAGPGGALRPARRGTVRASGASGPSPGCSPTCTPTPTCSTPTVSAAATRSRCSPRTATNW